MCGPIKTIIIIEMTFIVCFAWYAISAIGLPCAHPDRPTRAPTFWQRFNINRLWLDPSEQISHLIYLPFLRFIVRICTLKLFLFCCGDGLISLAFSLDFPFDLICIRINRFLCSFPRSFARFYFRFLYFEEIFVSLEWLFQNGYEENIIARRPLLKKLWQIEKIIWFGHTQKNSGKRNAHNVATEFESMMTVSFHHLDYILLRHYSTTYDCSITILKSTFFPSNKFLRRIRNIIWPFRNFRAFLNNLVSFHRRYTFFSFFFGNPLIDFHGPLD